MSLFEPLLKHKSYITFNVGDLVEGNNSYPIKTTSSGCPITGLAFSDSTQDLMYNSFQIPSNYINGTDAYAYIHYFNSATQSGTSKCSWVLDYEVFNEFENISEKNITKVGVSSQLQDSILHDTYIKATITISGSDGNNPLINNGFMPVSDCGEDTMVDDAVLVLLVFEFDVEGEI
jgi:hypothetical protein